MGYMHYVPLPCGEELQRVVAVLPKDVQQEVLQDVQNLHSSVSERECQTLMRQFLLKWTELVTDFCTYFMQHGQ
jgi:hypothetical protein